MKSDANIYIHIYIYLHQFSYATHDVYIFDFSYNLLGDFVMLI